MFFTLHTRHTSHATRHRRRRQPSPEHPDHPVGAVVYVLEVSASATSASRSQRPAQRQCTTQTKTAALLNGGIVILVDLVGVQLVQQALLHQRAGVVLAINPVSLAGNVVVDAAAIVGTRGQAHASKMQTQRTCRQCWPYAGSWQCRRPSCLSRKSHVTRHTSHVTRHLHILWSK